MTGTPFFIISCCFSTRYDRLEEDVVILDHERNHVDVILDDDEIDLLSRIRRLVWMIGNLPEVSLGKMKDHLLERDVALFLEPLVLFRIPFVSHGNNVHSMCVQSQALIDSIEDADVVHGEAIGHPTGFTSCDFHDMHGFISCAWRKPFALADNDCRAGQQRFGCKGRVAVKANVDALAIGTGF